MGLIASVERQLAKCTPTGCSRPVQTTSLPLSKLSLFTSPFCPLPLLGLEQALRGRFGRNCHPCCTDEETEFSRQGEPCPRSQLMRSAMVLRPGPSTALLLSTGQSLCCLAWHLRLPRIWLHLPPRSICQHAAPLSISLPDCALIPWKCKDSSQPLVFALGVPSATPPGALLSLSHQFFLSSP